MKNLYASAIAIGLGILGIAASRAIHSAAAAAPPVVPTTFSADVTQHHKHDSRDGLYLDPLFTQAAAAGLTRDLNFNGTIVGNVYAQPLYIDATSSPNGAMVIAVTESNNVYALNATTGAIIWQRNVGTPITSGLPCGNISPLGITATPVADLASHSLFLDAEVSGLGHQIFSLNFDTGAINAGWPVTLNTAVSGFDSSVQSSRAALGILGNIVYVPYGGRFGDCGSYRGRLVGVQMNNPATVMNWATTVILAGVWGPGGVANDGTNLFVTTGNGNTAVTWGGAEAVVRLQPGPVFSGSTTDFWAPTNWMALDAGDTDLGGSGPIIVDVPGATPSALVVAIGKDRNAYLLNRANLGGVSAPVAQAVVSTGTIIGAGATYRTNTSTYVVLRPVSNTLTAFKITATNPPTIATGWSASSSGRTAPFVTTTDGTNDVTVWAAGSDGRLRGYNGDDGAVIYNGGGANELMTGIRSFNTGISARGRIYYAADNKVYAFGVATSSTPTPTPTATATATAAPTATATATIAPTATATATAAPSATVIATPTATATASPSATPTPTPVSQAINLSTRMKVLIGDNVGIGGFIISGTVPKPVLLRAIGPSLTAFGVPGALADPVLELHGPAGFTTVTNDNWQDDPTQEALIIATGAPPSENAESAIVATLAPGNYTGIVSGKSNTTGVALIEVYDLTPSVLQKLGNISTRAFVDTGNNVVIAGFILGNNAANDSVIVRGIGPSLSLVGVPTPLANPTLELRNNSGTLLFANDDWQDDPAQAAILNAAGLGLTNTLESGIAATLAPGLYTAILAGQGSGTGVGLVEVYDRGAP
jgi:outer membrane protein assembly factor BamB